MEVWGAGSLLLCQLLLLLPLFTGQPAGGDAVIDKIPAIVTPLELPPMAQEACDMGRLGVMTEVGVELVGGKGGLT